MKKLEPASKSELETVEGGMINLERVQAPPRDDGTHGGAGYTGIMIHYKLTVIE